MAENKNISYLNKDFSSFKRQLIDFAKTYYPNTATDFSPSSPGTMFIEMASYVGDVLSFYLDNQVQENFLQYAKQSQNLYSLAYMLGYKPKLSTASNVELTLYQQVPATVSSSVTIPDFSYTLKFPPNTVVKSTDAGNTQFLISNDVDFSFSSSLDPTQVSVYQIDNTTKQPTRYLLSKKRPAISATINTTSVTFGAPQQFQTVNISTNNFLGILDVFDSEGNRWYEVDYLAEDVVFDSIKNTNVNDPNFSSDHSDTPYLLKLKQADRRFVTRVENGGIQLQFGSGIVSNNDETIIPNPDNVGMGLPFEQDKLTTAFSPTNFIFTDSYGISPSNTTLTIRYLTGGGVNANVQSNTITQFLTTPTFNNVNLDPLTANDIYNNTVAVNNLEAASGGGSGDSIEEIRQNSMAQFASQLRTVTEQDYLVRALSMPSKYGSLAKVYTTPQLASEVAESEKVASLDLYCLAYDNNRNLKTPSTALKNNLKTYLSQYRMINDSVNIKSGYIINIAVDFDIIVLPNYNSNQVIAQCISSLQNFFNIDMWQFNQPIIMRDLYLLLDRVVGVQTVKNVVVTNKAGTSNGYSEFGYDITGATIEGVIYPSIDPSVFELKYPNQDIKGRVVSY